MRMVDLIEYKKNNGEFNQQQIQFYYRWLC